MSDLAITGIHIVEEIDKFDAPSGASLAALTYRYAPVRYDTDGTLASANASDVQHAGWEGICVTQHAAAGRAVHVVRQGLLDVGNALSAMAIGALVYLSNTDGILATTPGTVNVIVGRVVPAFGNSTADKLLLVGKAGY